MNLSGEPFVILGTFRGGTSCLATALVKLGLYMGEPDDFQAANEFNKGGFWELEDMQALNAKALILYGMTYLGADHMPENWREKPGSNELLLATRRMLVDHFHDRPYWGWKEPATTSLFPLYKSVMSEDNLKPRYPIIVRHPLSVASSRKRQFYIKNADAAGGVQSLLPPEEQRALGLWVDYMLTNLRETKGAPRYMICYEDLLEYPKTQLENFANGLLPWKPTPEQMQAAIETINPEWSHSRFTLDDLKPWPSIVSRTYDLCLRAANDPKGLNYGKYDAEVDELWNEWETTSNMVRSLQMPPGHLVLVWREGGETKMQDHAYTPTGGWQTIRSSPINAPGETIQISVYQMTCQAWIGKAAWHVNGQEVNAPLMAGAGGIVEQPGALLLTSFGNTALTTKAPETGPAEFEIEFLLQFDMNSLNAASKTIASRLAFLRNKLQEQSRA